MASCRLVYNVRMLPLHTVRLQAMKYFYPILFTLYPVLFYYSHNQEELMFFVLWMPLVWSVLAGAFVWFSLRFLLRKYPIDLISAITLVLIFYFYSYHHIVVEVQRLVPSENGFVTGLSCFVVIFFVWKLCQNARYRKQITLMGIVCTLLLVGYSSISIGFYEVQRIRQARPIQSPMPSSNMNYPDIYYLVFDRYANAHTLQDQYGYDNSKFIDYLEDRGFYVADESYANYAKTLLSMVSSLNMDYLQELDVVYEGTRPRTDSLTELFQNNQVMTYLRKKGYRIVYSGDTWGPIAYNPNADANITLYDASDVFIQRFLATTAFEPLARIFLNQLPEDVLFSEDKQRRNRLYKFDKVKKAASLKGPKFIYMHTLLPHDPYLFDEDCQAITVEQSAGTDDDYIRQLRCTNKFIQDLVDHIQTVSGGRAVIVLQSDEGPFMHRYFDLNKDVMWTGLSDDALQSHMRILNAYYLPSGMQAPFEKDTTPVNSFRLIFNEIFSDSFPLQPNEAYLTPDQAQGSEYVSITKQVRFKN